MTEQSTASTAPNDRYEDFCAPPGASTAATWVGVVVIGVMFAAGLLAYALIRSRTGVTIHVPVVFWFSTGLLFIGSLFLYAALIWATDGRARSLYALRTSGLIGGAFVLLQIPGLTALLHAHREAGYGSLYGMLLMIVALHAAHVIGGLIAIAAVTRRFATARESSDVIAPMRSLSVYWHGMAAIWLMMFSVCLLAG